MKFYCMTGHEKCANNSEKYDYNLCCKVCNDKECRFRCNNELTLQDFKICRSCINEHVAREYAIQELHFNLENAKGEKRRAEIKIEKIESKLKELSE